MPGRSDLKPRLPDRYRKAAVYDSYLCMIIFPSTITLLIIFVFNYIKYLFQKNIKRNNLNCLPNMNRIAFTTSDCFARKYYSIFMLVFKENIFAE